MVSFKDQMDEHALHAHGSFFLYKVQNCHLTTDLPVPMEWETQWLSPYGMRSNVDEHGCNYVMKSDI